MADLGSKLAILCDMIKSGDGRIRTRNAGRKVIYYADDVIISEAELNENYELVTRITGEAFPGKMVQVYRNNSSATKHGTYVGIRN